VLAARGSRSLGSGPGSAYVIFGTASSTAIDLPALGQRGFRIDAPDGTLLSDAAWGGDVNGDGLADIVLAASREYPSHSPESAYVVFGKRSSDPVALDSLGGAGFRIAVPDAEDRYGVSAAGLGDMNRDSRSDIVVGGPGGSAYVVFGKASPDTIELAALGDGGYEIASAGATYDGYGPGVHAAGDVNGDGRADALINSYEDPSNPFYSGSTWVVFGKSSRETVDLRSLGPGGFRIEGPPLDDDAVVSVNGAGDVNRDRRADIVLTYPYATNYYRDLSGWTYVVYGKRSNSTVRLSALGSYGFQIASDTLHGTPFAVAGAGDFNRDGRADVALGGSGSAYVVFGRRSTGIVDLATLGRGGVRYDGGQGSDTDSSIDGAGDVNHDGFADLVVGRAYEGGYAVPYPYPGAVYVVLGHRVR
jgi:hypothetical protein